MGIIDSSDPQCRPIYLQSRGIVDEHLDAHLSKFHGDLGGIVIAENPKDTISGTNGAENQFHPRIDIGAGAKDFKAIVARHYANIDGQCTYDLSGSLSQSVNSINVEIR
jgi:hypothetical protein